MELNLVHYVWSNKYFSGYKILYYYFIELCGHKKNGKKRGKRKKEKEEKKKKNETPEGNVKHTIPQQRVHNTVVLLYLTFNTVLYDLIDSRIRRTHF